MHLFHTLYAGLLDDVYFHKVVTAWESAAATRVQVSLLLPSWEPAEGWLHSVRAARHLWPLQMSDTGTLSKVSAKHTMARERKRLGTRHVWETLDLNWTAIKETLFTRGPTGRNRQELYTALFGRARQGSARWQQAVYRGPRAAEVLQHWELTKAHYLSLRQGWGPSALDMTEFYNCFEEKDEAIQARIDELQGLKVQVWRTRKGVYRKKQYPDVRDERNAHTEG